MEQIEEQIENDKLQNEEQQEEAIIDVKNLDGGLELLVELAEKGDIDPWDVDIVEITNKYLSALNSTPRENLLNAGRAIFYASVLLRMKSEILLDMANNTLTDSQEVEDLFPEDMMEDEEIHIENSQLESFIKRSSLGKQQRKRKIILSDLIFALQQAEEEEERRAKRARIRAERNAHIIVAPEMPDDVMEIAHEEDIEDIVERIESVVQEHLTDEKPITFEYLSNILGGKVKPFLSLLFMAHRGSVVLEQDGDYGEVRIYKPGKVTKDMVEQEEANKLAEKENKEEKKKAKERKKRKRIADKMKNKIKDTATKIKDKILGKEEKAEDEPEVLPPNSENTTEDQAEISNVEEGQTLSMTDDTSDKVQAASNELQQEAHTETNDDKEEN